MTTPAEWQPYVNYRERYLNRTVGAALNQLVYLSAPYSKAEDKDKLMQKIMKISGEYMMRNPGEHIVSPLFNHFSLALVPAMGHDYAFWQEYSINLLRRCDKILVIRFPGWDESVGVEHEVEMAQRLNIPIEFVDPSVFGCE